MNTNSLGKRHTTSKTIYCTTPKKVMRGSQMDQVTWTTREFWDDYINGSTKITVDSSIILQRKLRKVK